MRILFITQKIDKRDAVLGFVHGWLHAFSRCFEKITAVCLEKGEYDLPTNVEVFSLGKEKKVSRLGYLLNFYKIIWRERKKYDAVFVHMNPEYVILGWLFWKLSGKKVVLWYNHTFGDWRARVAFLLADTICHTSPYAFSAGRKESVRMPAGVDTDLFEARGSLSRKENSILSLGRISPVKKIDILLQACLLLQKEAVSFFLDIVGKAPEHDSLYERKVKELALPLLSSGKAVFRGEVSNSEAPKLFSESVISINLTPKGNYDKTVIEAMASGAIPIVSSIAFKELIPDELICKENDPKDLAEKIKMVFGWGDERRRNAAAAFRRLATERESLSKLTEKLVELFENLTPHSR